MRRYAPIASRLFADNRNRLYKLMQPKSVAIFHANDEMPRSGDQTFPFRQNADLFYLSGIDQEETILVLFPEAPQPQFREILFLRRTSELIAIWEGHKYTKEEAREASGIQSVFWVDEFDAIMKPLLHQAENIYVNLNENDRCAWQVPYRDQRKFEELRTRYPAHQYLRLGQLMARLRQIKSDLELEVIREAVNITRKAYDRVLRFMKPGVMEYEVEAEIIHEFLRNRSHGHAYYPIIASGYSACVLHYNDNDKVCKDGDLVLMDFGAEYGNYAADLTRTIPANGKFTPRQKEVYNACLEVLNQATQLLRPGNRLEEYHREVGELMTTQLIKIGLLDAEAVKKQDPAAPLYKKYFMHGTSHFIGLDVHDVGIKTEPFQAGMFFSCEPGIYIPEENIGIRLENDILITNNGPVNLMQGFALTTEEVEAAMAS